MKTLREIEENGAEMLRAEDIAPIFGINAHSIRLQAHEDPGALGFPVVCVGRSVFIPKAGFLAYCRAARIEEVPA